jgi:hypothetical protein
LRVTGLTDPGGGAPGTRRRPGFLATSSHNMKSRASARPARSHATPTACKNRNHRSNASAYDRALLAPPPHAPLIQQEPGDRRYLGAFGADEPHRQHAIARRLHHRPGSWHHQPPDVPRPALTHRCTSTLADPTVVEEHIQHQKCGTPNHRTGPSSWQNSHAP